MYALSLKQPWATLLAHGRKTIEVRKWPTARRGRVLIHASKTPDERPEVWDKVPEELRDAAQLLGGIVGAGDIVKCLAYRSLETFGRDQAHHLNELAWFAPPVLYGFVFTNLTPLPMQRCQGWMRFFKVDLPQLES